VGVLVLLVLLSVGGGGWYVYTGHINTGRPCKRCQGLGFKKLIGSTYVQCKKCDGYGLVLRRAARHVQRKRGRAGKRTRPPRVVTFR
jgi:hypothetical protein